MAAPTIKYRLIYALVATTTLGVAVGLVYPYLSQAVGAWQALTVIAAAVVACGFFITSSVVSVFDNFTDRVRHYSERISTGEVSPEFLTQLVTELGDVGESLKYTAERLRSKISDLSGEKEKLEQTLSTMTDGVLVCNTRKRVVLANGSAVRLLGASEADMTGRALAVVAAELERSADNALAGRRHALDIDISADTGHEGSRHLAVRAVPLTDDNGAINGALFVLEDVTESRRLEQLRRDFVANASHELKTPVTSIQLLADALAVEIEQVDSDEEAKTRKFAKRLREETRRLSRLTTELLDLARIEESGAEPHIQSVSVQAAVKSAVSALSLMSEERGITVSTAYPPEVDPEELQVMVDPEQLATALLNLLENAIKYNDPNGAIGIEVSRGLDEIAIAVWDDGFGIPPDDLPRIFERFYRVDKARSKASGGTGLGLSIVRNVAEQNRGRVEAESQLGAGSRFTLFLPAA